MAVETRVIIDANAQNAIREIGKLDEAAGDADKTIGELDGQTVDVDTTASADGMDRLRQMGADAVAEFKALNEQQVSVDVDVDVTGEEDLDKVKTSADNVESSGRAAGAAVGTIGGAIGELPGIEGLGPVAEGLGQLSEAALEGEANIAQMGAAIGVMGAAALVMKEVQGHFEKIANIKAFREDEVKGYTEALKEADSTLAAITTKLTEEDGLMVNFFGSEEDVSGVFTALGTGVEDVALLIDGGVPKIDAWAEALRNAGADGDAVAIAAGVLKQNVEDLDKAQQNAKTTADFLGTSTNNVEDAADNAAAAIKRQEDNLKGATTATDNLRLANEQLRGDLDKREAYLNLQAQFDDLKVKGKEAWDAAATGAVDAESKARTYELAQIDTKNAVIDYNTEVAKVPLSVTTNMLAQVDMGQIPVLLGDIDFLAGQTHTVDIKVRTAIDAQFQKAMDFLNKPGAPRLIGTRD